MNNILETGKKVLETEANAIETAIGRMGKHFERAVQILKNTEGRVITTGMGKSGIIARKIAATLTSTCCPSEFLHPTEALHGDLGIIKKNDTVLALSTSGETEEVLTLMMFIKRLGAKLISLVGNPDSTLARESEVFIDCSVEREACPIGLVPTTSTTLTLAMGDAISIALMEQKGFTEEDFRLNHPGGAIGKKLLKAKHLMHAGDELPLVHHNDLMLDVVEVINRKKFGVGIVVDHDQKLLGIVVDGDLRRLLLKGIDFANTVVGDCMKKNPFHVGEDILAVEALKILEDNLITSLIVVDDKGIVKGLLHLHDLWRTEMI